MPTLDSLPTRHTALVDAAAFYVGLGVGVTPVYGVRDDGRCACANPECTAPGKHPVGTRWQKRAARTVDDARDHLDGHVGNLGIVLLDSGYVLLDFDGEAGLRVRDELAAAGMLPPTLTARSGSGGEHRLYRFASRHDPAAVTDRRVGVGWDVKRTGQFLVAPSRHACGGYYEWVDPSGIADLPDDLYDRIRRLAAPSAPPAPASSVFDVRRARAYVDKMPPAIAGQRGHDATFAVARRLVQDWQLSDTDAWALLLEYNHRCEPPWSERDLRHKLDSAKKAHTRVDMPNRPRTSAPAGTQVAAAPADEGGGENGSEGGDGGDGGAGGGGGDVHAVDWRAQLLWGEVRGKAKLLTHSENVVRILRLHPEWVGRIRYDEFRGRIYVTDAPWNEYNAPRTREALWVDEDTTRLAGWLRAEFQRWGFSPSVKDCERAVDVVARADAWHPVRQYLDALVWDNKLRLARFGATYLGAPETPYVGNVCTWWLTSAVARVYQPGCKADHVLILEGPQGIGKSTALGVLAGEWFSDSPIDLNSKDAYSQIRGKWIVELAELDSLFRTTSSRAKTFFSSAKDDYRPAYGRYDREQQRSVVFAGSVNHGEYLDDPTGARRFWPCPCGQIDLVALRRDRDQIWAEAVWRYREGGRWWPEGDEQGTAREEQSSRTREDPWLDPIRRYVSGLTEVTVADVLDQALKLDKSHWTRGAETRVGLIVLQSLGWSKHRRRDGNSLKWVYRRVVT